MVVGKPDVLVDAIQLLALAITRRRTEPSNSKSHPSNLEHFGRLEPMASSAESWRSAAKKWTPTFRKIEEWRY
jgi:hypothetical protein